MNRSRRLAGFHTQDALKEQGCEARLKRCRGIDSYNFVYSDSSRELWNARISLILLVGAGRFERPTPCAQGIGVASNGSIVYVRLPIFPTTWGTCFSLES
jgi:hypothetical protein